MLEILNFNTEVSIKHVHRRQNMFVERKNSLGSVLDMRPFEV